MNQTPAADAARTATTAPETTGPGAVSVSDNPLWSDQFEQVLNEVTYKDGYRLILAADTQTTPARFYFQVQCWRKDAITGEIGIGSGGKAYLSPHATLSELVQTAFGLYKSYEEHEAREFFRYRGEQVFGPHMDVRYLHLVAGNTDTRIEQASSSDETDPISEEAPYYPPCQEVSLADTRMLTRDDIWGAMFPDIDIPEAFRRPESRIREDLTPPITPSMFEAAISAIRATPVPGCDCSNPHGPGENHVAIPGVIDFFSGTGTAQPEAGGE